MVSYEAWAISRLPPRSVADRGLSKYCLVGAREPSQLEEPVVGGDGRDRAARGIGVPQGAPYLVEPLERRTNPLGLMPRTS